MEEQLLTMLRGQVGTIMLDIHTLLYASLAVVIGAQAIQFWVFTKIYGMREGIVPADNWFRSWIGIATLERGLIAGGLLILLGLALGAEALGRWGEETFGLLQASETMRLVIPSATAILLGFQVAYGSFFISVLEIRASRIEPAPERVPVLEDEVA